MFTRYLLPVVAAGALGFAVVQMTKAQQKPPPAAPPVEPAKSPFAGSLSGAGIVEPETENIAVGSHAPGVVDRVLVKVGDAVRPGDPLFRLDDRHLTAELAVKEAAVAAARAQVAKLARMPRPEEVPPAEAKVAEGQAVVRDAEKLFDRVRRLIGTSAVSDEELVRREMAVAVARAQLAKAKADLDLLRAGAWGPDREVAEVAVRRAEAEAAQTRTEVDRLTARAPAVPAVGRPAAGAEFNVLQVNVRPGEYVGNAQGQALVVLGHVGQLHVRVDVDENEIGRFRPGLPGVAKPRGAPGEEFRLRFVRVEPYVIPKRSLTGGNTERVDTRVLQVIYAVEAKGRPLYVGQQMDVFLDAGDNK